MAKMIVTYRTPADPAAFERHYFDVHVPLAKKLPGLISYETSKGPIAQIDGGDDVFFMAILHFNSVADIYAAANTECGQACAADRKLLAPQENDSHMMIFDSSVA